MRFHFNDTTRPSRVAKILRRELSARQVHLSLTQTQDVAARMFGYAGYQELHGLAGRVPQSPWDEECDLDTILARLHAQARVLTTLGLSAADAMAVVKAVTPSARGLRSDPDMAPLPELSPADRSRHLFLEQLFRAAGGRVSAIDIRIGASGAKVLLEGEQVLVPYLDISREAGLGLAEAAFDMAGAVFDPDAERFGEIRQGGLPEGVGAVRVAYSPEPLRGGGARLLLLIVHERRINLSDGLAPLGLLRHQAARIGRMVHEPAGLFLVAGSRGSGKTTLQNHVLAEAVRQRPGIRVVSVEQFPEGRFQGLVRIGYDSRAVGGGIPPEVIEEGLRHHPHVLRIDELRDGPGARKAVGMARDGVQVWSTLAASRAIHVLPRLMRMDREAPGLVRGIVVTNVVGKLCPHCRLSYDEGRDRGLVSEDYATLVEDMLGPERARHRVHVANPEGCLRCAWVIGGQALLRTGHSGRVMVAEIVEPDAAMLDLVASGREREAYDRWFQEDPGGTLHENLMLRIAAGEVDLAREGHEAAMREHINPERLARLLREMEAGAER